MNILIKTSGIFAISLKVSGISEIFPNLNLLYLLNNGKISEIALIFHEFAEIAQV